MTKMHLETMSCPVCGREEEVSVLSSTHSFGSPDLDFRSARPARDMLHWMIHSCSNCGYAAYSESFGDSVSKGVKEFVLSDSGFPERTWDTALSFEKIAKIAVLENDWTAAFYGYLHAAWASERHRSDEPSAYRKEALAVLMEHFVSLAIPEDERYLLFADLCRRTGDFASVTALEYQSEDDSVNRILAFQKELAEKHDTGVYRVDAVISPEERDSDVQVMRVTFEDIFGTDEGSGGRV